MLKSKFYTNSFLVLCIITISCAFFLRKVRSSSYEYKSWESDISFYNVFELSNGNKLAIGNAPANANMIALRFDSNGSILWKKAFGVYENNSVLISTKAIEKADGSIIIEGIFSNNPNNIEDNACVELTLSSEGKLIHTILNMEQGGLER